MFLFILLAVVSPGINGLTVFEGRRVRLRWNNLRGDDSTWINFKSSNNAQTRQRRALVEIVVKKSSFSWSSSLSSLFADPENIDRIANVVVPVAKANISSSPMPEKQRQPINELLQKFHLTKNVIIVSPERKMIVAEVYEGGQLRIGLITRFLWKNNQKTVEGTVEEPRVELALVRGNVSDFVVSRFGKEVGSDGGLAWDAVVVDVGQLTTVWDLESIDKGIFSACGRSRKSTESVDADQDWNRENEWGNDTKVLEILHGCLRNAFVSLDNDIAPNGEEIAMETLYRSRRGRRGRRPLTKKRIRELSNGNTRLNELLRRAILSPRIVTSRDASEQLYGHLSTLAEGISSTKRLSLVGRLAGAVSLDNDMRLGGRFRRVPCTFVSRGDGDDNAAACLLNGGWVAVDKSVKSGQEGRKFAQRALSAANAKTGGARDDGFRSYDEVNSFRDNGGVSKRDMKFLTDADERIVYRLECLAMGEDGGPVESEDAVVRGLEIDVREALRLMDLPVSSNGAREALVRIGRWSSSSSRTSPSTSREVQEELIEGEATILQPWSESILAAARDVADYTTKAQGRLQRTVEAASATRRRAERSGINNRTKDGETQLLYPVFSGGGKRGQKGSVVDLTSLPCICIDNANARFRDDAIGIRLRSSTQAEVEMQNGRSGSKWEILIHIADISDLFSPSPEILVPLASENLTSFHHSRTILRNCTASRGLSRYDLPLGPLHLLPPVALDALALATAAGGVNRCVTLWVYIDEQSGDVLDLGVERTLISPPLALSFDTATKLLEKKSGETSKPMKAAKAILAVVERHLKVYAARRLQMSKAERDRESRLVARELVVNETYDCCKLGPSKRSNVFQRNRGAKVIERALRLYGYGVSTLMKRLNVTIPSSSGAGFEKGGRLGTAPLRRYIDGVVQRQILSSLCDYGGPSLTRKECTEVNNTADRAKNAIIRYRSRKQTRMMSESFGSTKGDIGARQRKALHDLENYLTRRTMGGQRRNRQSNIVPAISTGRENEVVIKGVGAVGKCFGVNGSMPPGKRMSVHIVKLDPKLGVLKVKASS